MKLSDYFEIAQKIFSKDGVSIGVFELKCPSLMNLKIQSTENGIKINFQNEKPRVTVKKFIKLSLSLNGIHLSKNGGVLEIESFPDISFSYNQLQ